MSSRTRHFVSYSPAPSPSANRLGVASLEAWPAAGGGLLVGIAEPSFAGPAAVLRASVKTIFLRIDTSGGLLLILPYVALEPEARRCARALISDALGVPEDAVILADGGNSARIRIVDICPAAERSLQSCAAVAGALLRRAAAEIWKIDVEHCVTADGSVLGPGRSANYGELAADAALQDLSHGPSADTKASVQVIFATENAECL